ncbi:MAG: hypothetical protein GF364_22480 [Candidatus Lokiarchaeota archaeon]|nr:hypothetical protein [Candidatus Lokiarchaeota archaeon]
MFPFGDYLQVLKLYSVIAFVLWIPPLIPKWNKLVVRLNTKKIENKKKLVKIFFFFSFVIILIAIILINLFNMRLFRLDFENTDQEALFFTFFALFTFMLMPVVMGLVVATAYISYSEHPKWGDFLVILFASGALGMAGSFYHDVLWCGTRTEWYTIESLGGYDFDVWQIVVNVDSYDYRLLGISQGTLALFLVIYAIILFHKLGKVSGNTLNQKKKLELTLFCMFFVFFFGFFLFIIDSHWIFDANVTIHALFLGIPLIVFLCYQIGRILKNNNQIKN